MKHAKKFASLLLALVMVFALATTAFAAGGNSITVRNAVKDQEYKLYKMLDLVVNDAHTAYSYTVNSAWADFFKAAEGKTAGKGLTYVNIDAQGYVTWKENADVAAFAKDAEAFATGLSALKNYTATTDGDFTFDELEAGYYLVTSTLGTKAIVGTTPGNPNPEIQEKNAVPENVKTVEEDSNGNYGDKNDADIGQTVNFKSTITAQPGAENYVFHDTMSAGLTYGSITGITLNDAAVDASNYTVTAPAADGDTFDVTFTQAFCDTLKANDKIVISYTATLNENAVIAGAGNPNTSKLSYGDKGDETHTPSGTTPPSTTTTYTWDVDVFKYAKTGETETALAGATFTLSKNANGSNPIALVRLKNSEGNDTNTYRVAKTGETGTVTEITTDATGKFTIQGLDSDTYYLTETAAPAGYNMLVAPIKVMIDNNGNVTYATKTTAAGEYGSAVAADASVGIKVLNQTGMELPSTGGMGTTLFYILGSVLVLGAGVLLVVKKRMGADK